MYSSEKQEIILQRMLARVNSKFDKREGSIIYDATAPASVELQNFYISLMNVLNEVFVDTASRDYLIKHCLERGIEPKQATYAIGKGVFTPTDVEIEIGARFTLYDYNYTVIKKMEDGVYQLQCETVGSEVNGLTGQLIPIDYIENLKTAELVEVLILGDDEEDTESLRARYFESLTSEDFGGNKIDYKNKVLSIQGVGGVKVYNSAQWNGGGTVKLVIVDSDNGVPTFELVNQVQTIIDPETNQGEGVGIAPIGHFVTVVGAFDTTVNIECKLTFAEGKTWALLKTNIETAVDEYFSKLNETWQDLTQITVIIARLESYILNVGGVVDIQNTKLNGKAENLMLDKDSIVLRGTINAG